MLPIRTILHPTDFAPLADRAFDLACGMAKDYKARLVLLHVHEPSVPVGDFVPPEPPGHKESLLRTLKAIEPPPEVEVEYRLEDGIITDAILRVAGETKCDLIVLATHGRSGLGRVLLGSVAESVLRRASCPVLAVKPGADKEDSAGSTPEDPQSKG